MSARAEAAARFAGAPVARLATADANARPHVVPIVFAVREDTVYTAVDGKPKSTRRLRRLADIEANPAVSVLVDHYTDDWSRLWWVRADGTAELHRDGAAVDTAHALLRAKYPQYDEVELATPVIVVAVHRWTWWPRS